MTVVQSLIEEQLKELLVIHPEAKVTALPDGSTLYVGLRADEAVAFEDSPNGILAARAAGMGCVVVPGAITRQLQLPAADRVIESLDALPLAGILELLR